MVETPTAPASPPAASGQPPVVVKKYANRRLYNTETSSYITLENLAEMIRGGRDFAVYDAKSGDDITRGVLTQIIVEEESKGSALLPTAFLRQLIGFYGDSLQGVVPRYLEQAMTNFARQQQQIRQAVQSTMTPFFPFSMEELGRQNMAMVERALTLFNPFVRASEPHPSVPPGEAASPAQPMATQAGATQAGAPQPDPAAAAEIERLHHEVEALRHQLAVARAEAMTALSAQEEVVRAAEGLTPAPPLPGPAPGPRGGRPRKLNS